MKRRGFLGLFGKAAAAIVAAPVLARVPPEVIGEGYTVKDGIRTDGSFAKTLWPHIKAEWEKTYADEQYFGLAQVKQEGTSVTYGTSEILSNQEIDFSEYELIQKRRAECLAESMRKTKETVASDVYHSVFGIDR